MVLAGEVDGVDAVQFAGQAGEFEFVVKDFDPVAGRKPSTWSRPMLSTVSWLAGALTELVTPRMPVTPVSTEALSRDHLKVAVPIGPGV